MLKLIVKVVKSDDHGGSSSSTSSCGGVLMMMLGGSRIIRRLDAPLSMVLVQFFTTGMMVLSKIVISRGMFIFSLLAYRNVIGALFVAPFAFFLESGVKQKLGWKPLMWISINAFLGQTTALALYFYGLRDTSPSLATDFLNIVPVVTFSLSLLLRIESLDLKSMEGKAKLLGGVLCVGGAMLTSLYKGRELHLWPSLLRHTHPNLVSASTTTSSSSSSNNNNLKRGTCLLFGSCLSFALWFISQVKLLKSFPFKYWPTALTCLAGCIQSLILGLIIDRDASAWILSWDLQLLTIFYTGVLNTGATFVLIQWAISQKGPTYPSMFNSLTLIFTTLIDALFMGQNMTVGSLAGMVLIISGLYGFLWGKRKESLGSDLHKSTTNVGDTTTGPLKAVSAINPNTNSNREEIDEENIQVEQQR